MRPGWWKAAPLPQLRSTSSFPTGLSARSGMCQVGPPTRAMELSEPYLSTIPGAAKAPAPEA
jgi:hypothetical protein